MAEFFGTPGDDEINIDTLLESTESYEIDGKDGNDIIDVSQSILGKNQVRGGNGNDELLGAKGDSLFGEDGDDIIDTSEGTQIQNGGENKLYGGNGNDTLIGSSKDELFGGEGEDILVAGSGGATLTGGEDSDCFVLATGEFPETENIITDFDPSADVLIINGLNLTFNDLKLKQEGQNIIISAQNSLLATLQNVNLSDLSENNFSFDNDIFSLNKEKSNPPATQVSNLSILEDKKLLVINGDVSKTKVKFQLSSKSIEKGQAHQIAVFSVDENGAVDGILPNQIGYLQAALSSAKVILSTITDNFKAVEGQSSIIQGLKSDNLAFVLIKDTTIQNVLNNSNLSSQVLFGSSFGTNSSESLQISSLEDGSIRLQFEDYLGNIDFTDIELTVQITETNPPLGSFQEDVLVDFRTDIQGNDLAGRLVKTVLPIVEREASYNNIFGLYRIEDVSGTVRDPLTGNLIAATAENRNEYVQAALRLSQEVGAGFNTSSQNMEKIQGFETELTGGFLFAPFLIADGQIGDFFDDSDDNDSPAYFSYMGINPDGITHIRKLGDNIFGFEDLLGGGDTDFNDVVFKMENSVV
ncbi:MAG: DUF4114 domain-containing protein [Rivularia sp. (in: cyanobacteria)]